MTVLEFYEDAAAKSRGNLYLWARYLNKAIQKTEIYLNEKEIAELLKSQGLTHLQKVFLKLAMEEGTAPNSFVTSLSEPSERPHLNTILNKIN
jgi:hypothetical protein